MDYFSIIAIALSLSFDSFAVSISYGVMQSKIIFRQAVRIALVFALFQGGLTIGGYFLGSIINDLLSAAGHWIALGLLAFLGIKMIIEGLKRTDVSEIKDYSKTLVLFTLALGTSIDAFTIGVSFALLNVKIWISGFIIGVVTFLACMTAIRIGKSAGTGLGRKVEILGGVILIAIGLKIFLEHYIVQ